ncbi:MAG: hypothetical protein AAGF25_02705 [Pseudomonadota bacterium]
MSLQNRVTPFGNIVADRSRGLFTGNRGILHIPETKQLHPTRRWTTRAWIYCLCDFKGREREVFGCNGPNGGPGWTNLFFKDEATALAAGHRPCFYCQRERALEFRDAFSRGNNLPTQKAPEIDARLHAQRLNGKAKRLHSIKGSWRDLPNGTMVARDSCAYMVQNGQLFEWSPNGYAHCSNEEPERLITPPVTVAALGAGLIVT